MPSSEELGNWQNVEHEICFQISYINQDTSHLSGMLNDYSDKMKLDYTTGVIDM